jgi:hypothetical protein
MGQEVTRNGGHELSEQQARFVAALLDGAEVEDAKAQAGYSQGTPTVGILAGKLVQNAISAAVDGRMRGDLKLKAMKTLEKIMDGNSAQAALGAAKIVLEYGADADQGDDKPLTEMTSGELAALIDKLEAEKSTRAIDVTPGNGA